MCAGRCRDRLNDGGLRARDRRCRPLLRSVQWSPQAILGARNLIAVEGQLHVLSLYLSIEQKRLDRAARVVRYGNGEVDRSEIRIQGALSGVGVERTTLQQIRGVEIEIYKRVYRP